LLPARLARPLLTGLIVLTLIAVAWFRFGAKALEPGRRPPDAPLPNIVFVLVDALRADRLGVYGGVRQLTPAIDAFAAEGLLFEQVIAQAPWTQPSVASIFSAVYPGVHQVRDYQLAWDATFTEAPSVAVFSERLTTLAEALRQGGYQTAAFSANPFVAADFGFGQGFDHFDSSFASFTKESTSGRTINEAVFRWLPRRDPARPLFLYLHYMDVHGPYEGDRECLNRLLDEVERLPDKRELTPLEIARLDHLRRFPALADPARHEPLFRYREYWVARYEAGVRAADQHFEELRRGLAERGLWANACVIFASDHGEALCEHGFWDHGLSVHHNQLHVPLILRWPGVVEAGARVPRIVELFNLMPTLLDQLRLPAVEGVQGVSMVPLLQGRPFARRPDAFAEAVKFGTEQKAIYQDGYKLLYVESDPPRASLYRVPGDPQEQRSFSQTAGGLLARLIGDLQPILARNRDLAAALPRSRAPISEEQRRQLESLGYVGKPSTMADHATSGPAGSPVAPTTGPFRSEP